MLATRNTKMQVNISVFLFSSKLKTQLSSSADSSRLSTRTFVWGLYKLTRLVWFCCVAQEGDDRGELCFYSSAHPYAATLSSLSSLVLLSVPICCWVQKIYFFCYCTLPGWVRAYAFFLFEPAALINNKLNQWRDFFIQRWRKIIKSASCVDEVFFYFLRCVESWNLVCILIWYECLRIFYALNLFAQIRWGDVA